jgi:hypothetical protein
VPRSRRLSETRPCPYASEYNADRIVNWNDSVALDAVVGDARTCGALGINLPPATARQLSLQLAQAVGGRAQEARHIQFALLTSRWRFRLGPQTKPLDPQFHCWDKMRKMLFYW